MLYYLGKGTEFKKEDCKEYKTIEGTVIRAYRQKRGRHPETGVVLVL